MTISDKLRDLYEARNDIRDAIIGQGGDLAENSPLADYPPAIDELSGGYTQMDYLQLQAYAYQAVKPRVEFNLIENVGNDRAPHNTIAASILAPNGKVYFIPSALEHKFIIFDPKTNTVTTRNPLASGGFSDSYVGAVLAPNGVIYVIPQTSVHIMTIDTKTDIVSASTMGMNIPDNASLWRSGVLAPNGKIYCIPLDTGEILTIDPETNTATSSNMGADLEIFEGWSQAVLAPNGKIYCVPNTADDILIIDPETNTATRSNMGADLSGWGNKWAGGVLAPNGKIYCMPNSASDVLIIDPETDTAKLESFDGFALGISYLYGCLGVDGKIYIGRNVDAGASPYVEVINTVTDTLSSRVDATPFENDILHEFCDFSHPISMPNGDIIFASRTHSSDGSSDNIGISKLSFPFEKYSPHVFDPKWNHK